MLQRIFVSGVFTVFLISVVACSNPMSENFECVNLEDKNSKISFTKKFDSAIYSSGEYRFCKKDGNVILYADTEKNCSSALDLMKEGGTRLSFDEVVYTLSERSYIVGSSYTISYNCKKL